MLHRSILALFVVVFAVTTTATAGTIFYTEESSFNAAAMGPQLGGTEGFEEPSEEYFLGISNPLDQYANGPAFYPGDIEANLVITTNSLGGNATVPSIGGDLWWISADYGYGFETDFILTATGSHSDSLDVMFGPSPISGVSIEVGRTDGQMYIEAYGAGDEYLGEVSVAGNRWTPTFVGVWSTTPIERLNVWANDSSGQEFIDNISMFTPEPGTLSLLALGGLALLRRRR